MLLNILYINYYVGVNFIWKMLGWCTFLSNMTFSWTFYIENIILLNIFYIKCFVGKNYLQKTLDYKFNKYLKKISHCVIYDRLKIYEKTGRRTDERACLVTQKISLYVKRIEWDLLNAQFNNKTKWRNNNKKDTNWNWKKINFKSIKFRKWPYLASGPYEKLFWSVSGIDDVYGNFKFRVDYCQYK